MQPTKKLGGKCRRAYYFVYKYNTMNIDLIEVICKWYVIFVSLY